MTTIRKDREPGVISTDVDFIPLCVPCIQGNEWQYIKECLDTNWVSSVGSYVDRFEQMIADRIGTRFAIATVNGTAALHIALICAEVSAGDEVIVSDLTFIAPVNAIRYVGAWPVFIDAEPDFYQMDVEKLEHFLANNCRQDPTGVGLVNRTTGRHVTAIIPVHILGHPCDMDGIMALADRYGLTVIEDATESLGAHYKGRAVGHLGHSACLSFNGNKIMTTGGGGMILTDDESYARKARYLTTQAKDDAVEFVHHEIGYNYRLTNVLAAMGCAQLEQLDGFIARKREIARHYSDALKDLPGIRPPSEASDVFCTFWLYTIRIDEKKFGFSSRELMVRLEHQKIQTRPLWQPMHLSPAHHGSFAMNCPVSELLNGESLSLPCSVNLTQKQQDRVIDLIRSDYRRQPS